MLAKAQICYTLAEVKRGTLRVLSRVSAVRFSFAFGISCKKGVQQKQ